MTADALPAPRRAAPGWPEGRPALLAFLPRFLFADRWPAWRYLLAAWPLVALPALALGWTVSKLFPALGGPDLTGGLPAWLVFLSVAVMSPVVETLLMTGPVALLDRFFGPVVAAIGSALLWAVAHSLSAAGWGLVVWWPFLVFSIAYLSWRRRGYWRAVGLVSALHALNNALPVVALLALG